MFTRNMGCNLCKDNKTSETILQTNHHETVQETKKEYSWDRKEKADAKDFTFEDLKGETVVKLPGSINGQQFIIQNCEYCNIYLFDHINTVTIDDCINCNMIIGPVKGSVFIRNCNDCHLIAACQQFRTRDCQRVDVSLCSTTHPIIEASNNMRFGCYCLTYPELEEQFQKARLSVFNNDWCDVRDFTPVEEQKNWSLLPEDARMDELTFPTLTDDLSWLKLSFSPSNCIVPYTYGIQSKTSKESSIVLFFTDGHSRKRALSFIRDILKSPDIRLVRTKELRMTAGDVNRVLQNTAYGSIAEEGPVIGLEVNGNGCIEACRKLAKDLTDSPNALYISSDAISAERQIKDFFDLTEMQMAC